MSRAGLRIAAAAAFVLLAGGFIYFQTRDGSDLTENARAFFTVDDGKTWFADDLTHLPPFEKDGKPALRAFVYRGADGKDFVGYLQRFTPEAKRAIEQTQVADPARKTQLDPSAVRYAYTTGREVKRPGETLWINGGQGLKAAQVQAVKGANGVVAVSVEP